MLLEIKDDFDPEKIAASGQCFRVIKTEGERWRFISGDQVLYIQDRGEGEFFASCTEKEWDGFWKGYFDLDRNYREIRKRESRKNAFIDRAMDFGRGLRILRQDPWETLVTFIISQRKNIPAIAKAVEQLAEKYGHEIVTAYETIHTFPSPAELAGAGEDSFREIGLGYRAPYAADAVSRVNAGEVNLDALHSYSDEQLLAELQKIHGVGKKVANCVALFAYGRTACVPVDVWISRAISRDCAGESPFELYGGNAGIMQQYTFYYEKNR